MCNLVEYYQTQSALYNSQLQIISPDNNPRIEKLPTGVSIKEELPWRGDSDFRRPYCNFKLRITLLYARFRAIICKPLDYLLMASTSDVQTKW